MLPLLICIVLLHWSSVSSLHAVGHYPRPVVVHKLQTSSLDLRRRRRLLLRKPSVAPLYPGYGTHYVYVYVGTPPQRQSLIIDTGSDVTAFPCTGCTNCGQHTDNYFNLSASSSANVLKCLRNERCEVSNRYAEGSTWHGYKVNDHFWVGDSEIDLIPPAAQYATDFTFACQQSMTGLFRSQLADGILGLADSEDNFPTQLVRKNITQSRVFALCFRVGGGILTLGGVDTTINQRKSYYLKMEKPRIGGGYGVALQYVMFRDLKTLANFTVNEGPARYTGTKGVIIDSGATDTYLPASVATAFKTAFKHATGMTFSTESFQSDDKLIAKLPDIVFGFAGPNHGEVVEIAMPVANYVDSVGENKYSFRIFLSDETGTILGSNFLNGYNTVFDVDRGMIGMAKSSCNYEEIVPHITRSPSARPTSPDGTATTAKCDPAKMIPYTSCSASCNKNESSYKASGAQEYTNECKDGNVVSKDCFEHCSYHTVAKGRIGCPDRAWTECNHACIRSRQYVPNNDDLYKNGKCNYVTQTATCYSGLCPRQDGDYLIYLDMRVKLEPYRFSYVHTEYFYSALSRLLKVELHNIDLLHTSGNEYSTVTKLHFQLRLKARDYKTPIALHDAADKVVVKCRNVDFPSWLLTALNDASSPIDGDSINRFGWLYSTDLEVLSAVAIPIGDIRDPYGLAESDGSDNGNSPTINTFGYFILGIAMMAILIILFLLYMHFRLRQEFALLSKDKGNLTKSSETLKKLWARFRAFTSKNGANTSSAHSPSSLSKFAQDYEIEMSQAGLMSADRHLEDDEI